MTGGFCCFDNDEEDIESIGIDNGIKSDEFLFVEERSVEDGEDEGGGGGGGGTH